MQHTTESFGISEQVTASLGFEKNSFTEMSEKLFSSSQQRSHTRPGCLATNNVSSNPGSVTGQHSTRIQSRTYSRPSPRRRRCGRPRPYPGALREPYSQSHFNETGFCEGVNCLSFDPVPCLSLELSVWGPLAGGRDGGGCEEVEGGAAGRPLSSSN